MTIIPIKKELDILCWFERYRNWKNYYGKLGKNRKLSYSVSDANEFDNFMKTNFLNKDEKRKIKDFISNSIKNKLDFRRFSLILKRGENNKWIIDNLMIMYGTELPESRKFDKFKRLYIW